jgi:L-threonylcarbamoyladenylate synthase
MGEKIAAVLDGGPCELGIESTILDLTNPSPRILRAGPITASQLANCLGTPVSQPQHHTVAVSGNMPVHYQPRTPLRLKTPAQMQDDPGFPVARLVMVSEESVSEVPPDTRFRLQMPVDKAAYARLLYRTLYEADQLAVREIWVEQPPDLEIWLDIHDRLKRASASN